jgi:hypothetical protein
MMIIVAVLSSKAQALLSSGRVALRPTDADRSRVQNALQARLSVVVPQPRFAGPRWQQLSGIIGIGLVGGVLFFAFRHGAGKVNVAPRRVAPIAVRAAAPMSETQPEQAALAPALAAQPVPVVAEPVLLLAHPAQGSLAQEVALLSRATSDLHRGNAAAALQVLNEHWRKFPNGLLSEERRGARAQALCLLGRTSEAQAELARLTPQSPAAARAKQACGAALPAAAR